jgi:hypothetical protein
VLCAHTDSARAGGLEGRALRRLYSRSLDLAQRAAIALAALALLSLLGFPLPGPLAFLAGLAGGLAGCWLFLAETWNQLRYPDRYSPGANDNASGVGVLLAVAERWAGTQLQRAGEFEPGSFNLEFLFTTAEESGLHGARAYAASQAEPAGNEEKWVISLDMVGAGQRLRYVEKDGTLFPRYPSARLNGLIRQVELEARPIWYIEKSGDFLPCLQHGIPAAALQMTGSPEAELAYHSRLDTTEGLETPALEKAAVAVWKLIQRLEAETNSKPSSEAAL